MFTVFKKTKRQGIQSYVPPTSAVAKLRVKYSPRDYTPSELSLAQLGEQYRRRNLFRRTLKASQKIIIYEEANLIKANMRTLQQSKMIDDGTKKDISRRVRRLLHDRSIIRIRAKYISYYSNVVIISAFFFLSLPLAVWFEHQFFGTIFLSTLNWLTAIMVVIPTSLLAIVIVASPMIIAFRRQEKSEVFATGCIWPFASLVLDYYVQNKLYLLPAVKISPLFMALSLGAFWGYLFASGFGLCLCIAFILAYNVARVTAQRSPDGSIINQALFILSWLEQKPQSWLDIKVKGVIIESLDRIAWIIERNLPRSLRSDDLATNIWHQGSCSEIAASIRVLATWVLRPMSDTREQFTKRVASILVNVATGNWDNLERSQPEKITKKRYIYTAAVTMLRVALIAFIPVAALYIFHLLRPKFAIPDTLVGLVIVWATVTILANLDPNLSAKVSVFKEAVQSVSFPGKTGKD